ncbi:hypothetical protein L228DRAFT_134719 [Xylona heveae TC161]|uniref:Uncharacterized protein n=1 Tax=Xylona heveae (strain CBS 132557 / TC161) TaxID=1328760 RepID=A0A165GXR2_XYLHT|nr:hypothetical protein L228DRAFT_134719 [Xylona heveae TC161]KZF22734.1 hypothetical protein L228DRAFT_134719 [Xylona heveae TC161]
MLSRFDDCDDCVPSYMRKTLGLGSLSTIAVSSIPFLLTFFIVSATVLRRLFPLLSGQASSKGDNDHHHSAVSNVQLWNIFSTRSARTGSVPVSKRVAALTFSTTIALSAVLAELILCEISNTLNPTARTLFLKLTISTLLTLLIVVTPLLELHSVVSAAGWKFTGPDRGRFRLAWVFMTFGFAAWIAIFWWLGRGLLGRYLHADTSFSGHSLSEACLERIGVIGILLMAMLSGFASVSSPWQTFFAKNRPVTESDVARKQAGLQATDEMLEAKRSRLRALERKTADAPPEGFMTKVMDTIRGNGDLQERRTLAMEISGLETMRISLANSLSILRSRRQMQQRSATVTGRVLIVVSYIFSAYCMYRIMATFIASLRRWWYPTSSFAGTDPVNNFLALIVKHWDPTLDRLAWSRQISFLLSGVILLASFNSVVQTFQLFSRFMPKLVHHAQANLALLVSQISATYVISSALLLRSNLPREMGSVISEALGAPLEPRFVDRWFDGWFLAASVSTAVGIFLGRKLGASGEWDDDYDDEMDLEMGKRS